jgi:hypothetical protein
MNANMLRWLGMQVLGQTPKHFVLHKVKDSAPKAEEQKPTGFEFKNSEGKVLELLPQPQRESDKQPHENQSEVESILKEEACVQEGHSRTPGHRRVIDVKSFGKE